MPALSVPPESLFSPHRPATAKVFVGRDILIEKLYMGCMSGRSFGLIGEPGIGKTSLLLQLKNTIVSRQNNDDIVISFPIYLEFDKTRFKTPADILKAILIGLVEEIVELTGLNYREELDVSDENLLVFDAIWNSILSWYTKESHRTCKLILFFDDLHRGANLNCLSEAFSILRPIVSREQMAVVLCGEMPLEKEFRNDVSSLRNLVGEQIYLPPLLINDIGKILSVVEDYDWDVETGVLDLLFDLTDGHPYLIHYFLLESIRRYNKVSLEALNEIDSNKANKLFLESVLKKQPKFIEKNSKKVNRVLTTMITISFLAADPSNASRLRLGEEQREIQEKILMGKQRDHIKFIPHPSARAEDVNYALLNDEAQIIHFSGHGKSTGEICFEDNSGNALPVSPSALSNLFSQFSDRIQCVILNACYSKPQAEAISKHIPFVIGMKRGVDDKSAIAFSVGFYQAIVAGRSIEQAFNSGCALIDIKNGIEEGSIPILLKR